MTSDRRATLGAAALTGLAGLLPFLPGLLGGQVFFFRDLSRYFFPLRRFVAEGLRAGEIRWWNPYVHEGEALALPPVGYPPDLLQALWPDERFFSWLLALHFALAAAAAFGLGRRLGFTRAASSAAGVVYATGGFALSTANLYVYAQVLAWAPLAVWGLLAAAERGWSRLALGAVPVALCFSTTGLELALQVCTCALVLLPRLRQAPRLAAAAALGVLLAALPLAIVSGSVGGSARGTGFPTDVVLSQSVHPLSLAQTVVACFHGDLAHLADRWWGQNFFPRGFPYIVSLYLGAAVLATAAVGAARGGSRARRLAALAAVALLVCLGRWAGWGALIDHLSVLRVVRFPVKAFFTVHLCLALLAGFGLDRLQRAAAEGAWKALAWTAALPGLLLAGAPLLPAAAPGFARWFAAGFFPQGTLDERLALLRFVAADAAQGGVIALALALTALLAARGTVRPVLAAAAAVGLLAADLLRAGAGLNPSVPASALRLSPEAASLAAPLRAGGARVFTCEVDSSPAYIGARVRRGAHHVAWSAAVLTDTLSPFMNLGAAVPTAFSSDLTMLVPEWRVLRPGESCADVGVLVDRLRRARVAHVLSLDRLEHPALRPLAEVAPLRLAPLRLLVYALDGTPPALEVSPGGTAAIERADAGHVAIAVNADGEGTLLQREATGPGWTARVNGRPAAVTASAEGHRVVAVPAGPSRVVLSYRPPRLAAGGALSALAALMMGALWWRGGTRSRPPAPA